MEDGHRSWRWTATRYEVACVRLLDSRDIRASVWVFPTKSNAKIANGWDELARSVSNKKKSSICDDFVLAWKNDDLMKNADKVDVCRHPCRDSHHQNKTGEVFLFCIQFSSFLFSQNIIQYRNTYRNCKSLFKSFLGGERRLRIRLRRARGLLGREEDPARTST